MYLDSWIIAINRAQKQWSVIYKSTLLREWFGHIPKPQQFITVCFMLEKYPVLFIAKNPAANAESWCLRIITDVMKHHDQNQLGRKGFIWLTHPELYIVHWRTSDQVGTWRQELLTGLLFVLVRVSIVVKRHHDHGNS